MSRLPGFHRFALLAALITLVTAPIIAASAGPGNGAPPHYPAAHSHPAARTAHRYSVTITRTAGGVAHIRGRDYGSVGYGVGFAFAHDDICAMAEDLVTVEGERSRYFGPANTYTTPANGVTASNLDSDIYWKGIAASGVVHREMTARHGLFSVPGRVRQLLAGYVAGYNRYLKSVGGAKGITDPACKGRAWVHPMSLRDEYLRLDQLIEIASRGVVMQGIAEAAPPGARSSAIGRDRLPTTHQIATLKRRLAEAGIGSAKIGSAGSNAIAVGKAGTRDHTHGLLLGNPHFPWSGTERFYQMQLTIPGKLNVEGGTLYGMPLVMIGHTENLAWSHTDDTAYHFVPVQLKLASGSPTTYLVDGKRHRMTSTRVAVQVRRGHHIRTIHHRLYSTIYGPVFDNLEGQNLGWTNTTAYALWDANAEGTRVIKHFYDVNRAQSVAAMHQILDKYVGLPWVNTIAADRSGHAMYADIAAIPDVSNQQVQRCNTGLGGLTFPLLGLPVLDGSRSNCAPAREAGAARPGIFPSGKLPFIERSDYVTNSNDSYWLANPAQPLTGFARIIGDTGTPRSLRTRYGLVATEARIAGTDGQGPAGFTRQDMQNLVLANVQYGAELVKPALVEMCNGFVNGEAPTSSGGTMPVGNACSTLAAWNGREDVNARGAVLFRAFWEKALALPEGPWSTPFDPSNPVTTPNGLNTADPKVQQALGDALQEMSDEHLPYDVKLGTVQYVVRGHRHIAIPGGPGDPDGDFDAISENVFDPQDRGVAPSIGSSYIQVVTWHGKGCPDARTLLTYSQSANPNSRWYADQTRMFAQKHWETEDFCSGAVRRHALSTRHLTGR